MFQAMKDLRGDAVIARYGSFGPMDRASGALYQELRSSPSL
jgi:hypothetical protein